MAQKEELLYDVMNCQVPPEFLGLFQPSLPVNLLSEILIFVERLSEGRLAPQYRSVDWQYNTSSLHSILFGENSRLSDRLLALIIHPEEDVQIHACKVILSLRLEKEESRTISSLPFAADISSHPFDSTRSSHPSDPAHSTPLFSTDIIASHAAATSNALVDDPSHSFHPIQGADDTNPSFYPLESSGPNFQVHDSSSISMHPLDGSINDDPLLVDTGESFHPIAPAYSDGNIDS